MLIRLTLYVSYHRKKNIEVVEKRKYHLKVKFSMVKWINPETYIEIEWCQSCCNVSNGKCVK